MKERDSIDLKLQIKRDFFFFTWSSSRGWDQCFNNETQKSKLKEIFLNRNFPYTFLIIFPYSQKKGLFHLFWNCRGKFKKRDRERAVG